MAKSKFQLTSDLINIENGPVTESEAANFVPIAKKTVIQKKLTRLTVNLDENLKDRLRLLCIKEKTNLTAIIEKAIVEYLMINEEKN